MPDQPSKPAPPTLNGPENQSRGESFIKIRWTKAQNSVRYSVKCNGVVKDFPGPAIPFETEFDGLQHNSQYTISIVAFNQVGHSNESDPLVVFTRPTAPSDLTLAPGELSRDSDFVLLKWTPVADVPLYQVSVTPGGSKEFGPPGPGGHAFAGLPPNSRFDFVVRSFDPAKGGLSLSTSPVLGATTRPPKPLAPSVSLRPPGRAIVEWAGVPAFPDSGIQGVAIQLFATGIDGARSHIHTQSGVESGNFDFRVPDFNEYVFELRIVTPILAPFNESFFGSPSNRITATEIFTYASYGVEREVIQNALDMRMLLLGRYYGNG